MDNTFFLKIEIIIFFLSLWYIWYYLYEKIYLIFRSIKNLISPSNKNLKEKIEQIKNKEEKKKNLKKDDESKKKSNDEEKNTTNLEDSKKIQEIIKRAKVNKTKWYYNSSKSLIIEWLAIDKLNKDLNLELASIYEEEKEYKKAEYIYNDLLSAFKNNFEILKKLWYNLAIQGRYEESIYIYTKWYEKRSWDIEIMEYLSDLNYEIKDYKKSLFYTKLFLKQFPRNTEKLKMKWFCHENLWEVKEALSTYKKIIELQPYNSQVSEKIKYLEANL